ncbi:hypothetical protein [Acidithiobacillus sp.]|jgi:hypothetical protein|uniref:hypothetical protein n=1 Tax=Acidithiobacillus sp. TaxID=1872118 RepID=UPI0032AED37B
MVLFKEKLRLNNDFQLQLERLCNLNYGTMQEYPTGFALIENAHFSHPPGGKWNWGECCQGFFKEAGLHSHCKDRHLAFWRATVG